MIYVLLVLHIILSIMYGCLTFVNSSWAYGICTGCWILCVILDIIRLSLL